MVFSVGLGRYLSLPPTRHDLTQGQKPEGLQRGPGSDRDEEVLHIPQSSSIIIIIIIIIID